MESEIIERTLSGGEKLRVQTVRFDSFNDIGFMRPPFEKEAFEKLCTLYREFTVPSYSFAFGTLVHFYVPEDVEIPDIDGEQPFGRIYDPTVRCNALFRTHARLRGGKIVFDNERAERLFSSLEKRGCVHVCRGRRNSLSFLPVAKGMGFISRTRKDARLKVNGGFFVMDLFDLGSVYDRVSGPIGLCVKDGRILEPPLFDREVLMVKNGMVSVGHTSLGEIGILIDGTVYRDGVNARILSRPRYRRSPKGGTDIVVIGRRVIACRRGGECDIPSSGFVIHLDSEVTVSDPGVSYSGLEDVSFAIQAGNSAVRDGNPTEGFESPFYDFRQFWKVSFPPSMYPLDYVKDRAPRIVLGADRDGRPMLLWFEGAAKFGHDPKKDSVGASLSEAARIAVELGMYNGVHLDGGGSAQIMVNGTRRLKISDRNKDDFSENERAVPVGLYVI